MARHRMCSSFLLKIKIYSNGFSYSLVSSKKKTLQFAFLKMTLEATVELHIPKSF